MAITFKQFKFHNQNGINADVTLEANGQTVVSKTVAGDGDLQVPLNIPAVSKLKLTVSADPGDHPVRIRRKSTLPGQQLHIPCTSLPTRRSLGLGGSRGKLRCSLGPELRLRGSFGIERASLQANRKQSRATRGPWIASSPFGLLAMTRFTPPSAYRS